MHTHTLGCFHIYTESSLKNLAIFDKARMHLLSAASDSGAVERDIPVKPAPSGSRYLEILIAIAEKAHLLLTDKFFFAIKR